jgi:hypothetical protein
MPADNGLGAHDGDRLEDRAADAGGESEHDPISGTDAGLWHGTTQDDDLLAHNDIFREERGAGLEDRTQCAQDGLKDFDEHHGAKATRSGSREKSRWKLDAGSTWYRISAADSQRRLSLPASGDVLTTPPMRHPSRGTCCSLADFADHSTSLRHSLMAL